MQNRRFASLSRKKLKIEPRKKIHIFTEGLKTEKEYFLALARRCANSIVAVEVYPGLGAPVTISQRAIAAKKQHKSTTKDDRLGRNDEFWVVFDKDLHEKIGEAIALCESNGVRIGYSNPCFELWIILHYSEYDRACTHLDVQKELEKICPSYDRKKRKYFDFSSVVENVIQAEERAQRQHEKRKAEGSPPRGPYTTIFELTKRIRTSNIKSIK